MSHRYNVKKSFVLALKKKSDLAYNTHNTVLGLQEQVICYIFPSSWLVNQCKEETFTTFNLCNIDSCWCTWILFPVTDNWSSDTLKTSHICTIVLLCGPTSVVNYKLCEYLVLVNIL